MQKIFNALAVIGLLVSITITVLFFNSKKTTVYVDSQKLVNGYQGMVEARAEFQKKATVWKANIDTLTNEVKDQIFKYEKESAKMTAKERQLSQELIKTKQKQLGEYQQAMNQKAQQEDSQMTKQVLDQVNAYLKKYGEKNGYTIILAATEYGNIAYANEALDITDKVLEGLNKEYSGK